MSEAEQYSLRESTANAADLAGCFVELHADGTVVLVVDGERLFQFDSVDALLAQYELVKGERRSEPPMAAGEASAAWRELAAAEVAVNVAVGAINARPRAEKMLLDPRVARAIERVRVARERLLDAATRV